MVLSSQQRRFRFSIRSLMICVALCALVMTPILWTVQRQRLLALAALRAAEARRASYEAARALTNKRPTQVSAGLPAPEPVVRNGLPATGNTSGLWAALSANHSVFPADEVQDLVVEFTIVNGGGRTIDPGITGSLLMINGKEIGDSALVIGNGPRETRFTSLPPGDYLRFTSRLGDHFTCPGTYRISWRSGSFLAPEITIRVLPSQIPRRH